MGKGAVFEKAGQRSTWGSTAPLPSKSHKPPIFRGRGPSQAGGLRRQAQAEPSLVCIWEQTGCWTRGARQSSIPANGAPAHSKASRVGSKGTHCTLKPFKILPKPQVSSQKEDL